MLFVFLGSSDFFLLLLFWINRGILKWKPCSPQNHLQILYRHYKKKSKEKASQHKPHCLIEKWTGMYSAGTLQHWTLNTKDAARITKEGSCGLPLELLTMWAKTDKKQIKCISSNMLYLHNHATITICSWNQSTATCFVITHIWQQLSPCQSG